MSREVFAVRQAAQINNSAHPCLASRTREVRRSFVLFFFEIFSIIHRVD